MFIKPKGSKSNLKICIYVHLYFFFLVYLRYEWQYKKIE